MKILTSLAIAGLLAAAGCSKSPDKASAPAPDETKTETPPAPRADEPADDGLAAVLGEYESIRSLLASDEGAGVAEHAAAIKKLAGSAEVSAAAKPHLETLAVEAGKLEAVDAGDLPALRLAFGEVSKSLIAVIEAEPDAGEGLHTFECPMAEGYKLWVQPDPELENPYMGQKMLRCGAAVTAN
jgi:hypothetical protein